MLPNNGNSISLSQIGNEYKKAGISLSSLSQAYSGGGYVPSGTVGYPASGQKIIPPSGPISFSDFYGSENIFKLVVDSTSAHIGGDPVLWLPLLGWDGVKKVVLTYDASLPFRSGSSLRPAVPIYGSFPNGIIINNYTTIVGHGGDGGDPERPGQDGGHGIEFKNVTGGPFVINNYNKILGGGGGGGAGSSWGWSGLIRSTAGSGGASGGWPSSGGINYYGQSTPGLPSTDTNDDGIYETPGASTNWGWGGRSSSPGGAGGNYGQPGGTGGGVDGAYDNSGYPGGLAGKAISKNNSPITVVVNNYGTIIGLID